MANRTDFQDVTPSPIPAPKREMIWGDGDGGMGAIPWPAGQTLQQAIASAMPAAVRSRTNAFNATIRLQLRVRED